MGINPIKPAKPFLGQIRILKSRNIIPDEHTRAFLTNVNYYRLSGYIRPFLDSTSNVCNPKIDFSTIISIYEFDSEMRSILQKAIETIEVSMRTKIAHYFSLKYSPLGYLKANNFDTQFDHIAFLDEIEKCIRNNNKSPVIKHHLANYGPDLPFWVLIDYFTLGMLSKFYAGMLLDDQRMINSTLIHLHYKKLVGWLRCACDLRNRCAHYSRLYYWNFSALPSYPKGDKTVKDRLLFTQIYTLKLLYPSSKEWNSSVGNHIVALIKKHIKDIKLEHIGFPANWEHCLLK